MSDLDGEDGEAEAGLVIVMFLVICGLFACLYLDLELDEGSGLLDDND